MPSQTRGRESQFGRSGRRRSNVSSTLLTSLGFKLQVTVRNVTAFLVHCSASILFLVFLNASQPFLIHQLESNKQDLISDRPSRAGSLSGSLIFYDELLSTFTSLIWGALAELVGLAAVTSTSYVFIAMGLVAYTLPHKPWPDLIAARLVFAIGGSGATAMLSGILSDYSGQDRSEVDVTISDTIQPSVDHGFETGSQSTVRPIPRNHEAQSGAGTVAGDVETDSLLESSGLETAQHDGTRPKRFQQQRHGRLAAIAGIFTGLGALVAVFGLVRLPQKIAEYLERRTSSEPTWYSIHLNGEAQDDLMLRRATVMSFLIVAGLALLVAAITAAGLRNKPGGSRGVYRTDGPVGRTQRIQDDYGALHDSTVALLDDSRQARRARLRQRLERRSQAAWTNVIRSHIRRFVHASVGGFRMVGPVRVSSSSAIDTEDQKKRHTLALELRMAYLGGALARAFTIGTTAFLPLLVSHYYYTSGACRQLPVPTPDEPLPSDDLKKLCRSAFTTTAVLGGTAQLTALLAAPLIGLLCDWLSPTTTISFTSALGAAGFYLLGTGAFKIGADNRTGAQQPKGILKAETIVAAVLIGIGQIGAIVASLAGCAKAKGLLAQDEAEVHHSASQIGHSSGDDDDTTSGHDTLVPGRRATTAHGSTSGRDRDGEAGQGAGAIAGAYTCTGSLSILLISKMGGLLFDRYVPSPFLLIAGFSALVSIYGIGTIISKRLNWA